MTYKQPLPSQIPDREYKWVFSHYSKLAKKYPNQWIAFLSGRILAHGKDLMLVARKAKKILKEDREVPTIFLEKGIHIY